MASQLCTGLKRTVWILLCVISSYVQFVWPIIILQDSMMDTLPVLTGLNRDIRIFRGNVSGVDFFHQPHVEDSYFLIGARNVMYNISLSNLAENKRVSWYSSPEDVQMCLFRQKTPLECQNYIRVIAKTSRNEYLVCGTNAFRPTCRTYRSTKRRSYSYDKEEIGVARCPYDPMHNSTSVYVGERLYSATVADLSGRDSLIFSKPLRTEQHDSQWLNDPNFVSSFAHNDKVYFFFRETAVENINCGKVVFSRVARVCRRDTGGSRVLRNTWTSFFKARLNCSIPGEFPFYFDEIQSTSDLGEGNLFPTLVYGDRVPMVYALFSTPRNSLRGTAVCAYKFSEIVSVFEGAYKEQRTAYSNWLPVRESDVPEPHPAKSCPNDSQILSDQTLNFIKSHPLMDKSVPAFGGQPIIVQTSLSFSFSQIAIDWQVHAADQRFYDILYIGTDDGRVLKAFNKGRGPTIETVVVEVLPLFPNGAPITSLRVSRDHGQVQKKLIAVSRDEIRSVSLHRCHLKTSCSACVALKDPYCSWLNGKCANSNQGMQSIETGRHTKCPAEVRTTRSSTVSESSPPPTSGLCPPCLCHQSVANEPQVESKSLRNDNEEVPLFGTTARTPKVTQRVVSRLAKDVEDQEEENEQRADGFSSAEATSVDENAPDSRTCAERWEYTGYPLAVLLLVAFLPAIFAFFLGILIGYYLTVHKHSRFCHSHETSGQSDLQRNIEKTLSDEEPLKQEQPNSPNSELRYKVVVNELKANNSKQPNSSVESTLQKANLNFL